MKRMILTIISKYAITKYNLDMTVAVCLVLIHPVRKGIKNAIAIQITIKRISIQITRWCIIEKEENKYNKMIIELPYLGIPS